MALRRRITGGGASIAPAPTAQPQAGGSPPSGGLRKRLSTGLKTLPSGPPNGSGGGVRVRFSKPAGQPGTLQEFLQRLPVNAVMSRTDFIHRLTIPSQQKRWDIDGARVTVYPTYANTDTVNDIVKVTGVFVQVHFDGRRPCNLKLLGERRLVWEGDIKNFIALNKEVRNAPSTQKRTGADET